MKNTLINHFNCNYESYPLYMWEYSAIDSNTAYFYFLNETDDVLVMIEYWADEYKVADAWQMFAKCGDCLEENSHPLNKAQIEYFTTKCKELINEED